MTTAPSTVVDAVGKRCPVPVIELAKRIDDVEVGCVVRVLADDPAARVDIPVWCRMKGHEYVGSELVDPGPAYDVRRLH